MLNPEQVYHELTKAGDDWADKKTAYKLLDDATKSVLADLALNFLEGGKMSKTEAEMRALASRDFKNHLASVNAAERVYLQAQVKYDSLKALSDHRRSQEATRRQEMKL